jgi:hypothetical protein
MLNEISSAIGIDARVNALQNQLFTELLTVWGITSDDYESYSLCQRNYKGSGGQQGYVPEILTTGAKDYKELLHNDKVAVQSFFGFNDNAITHDGVSHETANLHLIFFTNLSLIKSTALRADIDARRDVYKILKRGQFQVELVEEIIGVDSVLREYSGVDMKKMFAKCDMRPNHCFRFNLSCTYNPKTIVNNQ